MGYSLTIVMCASQTLVKNMWRIVANVTLDCRVVLMKIIYVPHVIHKFAKHVGLDSMINIYFVLAIDASVNVQNVVVMTALHTRWYAIANI